MKNLCTKIFVCRLSCLPAAIAVLKRKESGKWAVTLTVPSDNCIPVPIVKWDIAWLL